MMQDDKYCSVVKYRVNFKQNKVTVVDVYLFGLSLISLSLLQVSDREKLPRTQGATSTGILNPVLFEACKSF